ncbi:MAG: hypothetical protein NC133_03995 [Prevotella sp.]|nr:hypothetical protein [Prevotella sp.]
MTTQEKKVGSVLDNFLQVTKPTQQKEKTTLLNLRIPEKLRDDYKRLCFERKTDMSKEIVKFIWEQLENA